MHEGCGRGGRDASAPDVTWRRSGGAWRAAPRAVRSASRRTGFAAWLARGARVARAPGLSVSQFAERAGLSRTAGHTALVKILPLSPN